MSQTIVRASAALVLVTLVACGKDPAGPPVPTKLLLATAPSATAQNRVALATQPVIQLADNGNNPAPKAGVLVAAAVTTAGGAIIGTSSATTNASGVATFTNLGVQGTAAAHTIEFTAAALTSISAQVTTSAGAASTIAAEAGNNQSATVNTAVTTAPSAKVTDADGNAVSGIAVTFFVGSGGGIVTGGSGNTNAQGIATVGSWTLGTTAGANTLTANGAGLSGSPVTFTATGTAGAATKLVMSTSPSTSPQNRVAFATQPAVRLQDGFSNNRSESGVTVTASITSGGGTLLGTASAQTDANGIATFTNLAIAGTVGTRNIGFTATGLSGTSASVTTIAGPATNLLLNAGDQGTALTGGSPPIPPSVKVSDPDGNGVSGVTVNWAVTAGGGSVGNPTSVSNSSGIASNTWTLGSSPGTNNITASVALLTGSPVTFTATAATSLFNIDIVYLDPQPTPAQQAAFSSAVSKWRSIITGDIPAVNTGSVAADVCIAGQPAMNNETIDDLRIYVKLEPIDGAGNVLGSAGPCLLRNGTLLPGVGSMRFDSADLATMEGNGTLTSVILHEMGHVLGIGTLWSSGYKNFLRDSGTVNPYYNFGTEANTRFDAVGGGTYSGSPGVPLENTGSIGTRDAHWREANFETELMTGFIDLGANPLSVVTIGALQDIGYSVNYTPADSYALFSAAAIRIGPSHKIHLKDDILRMQPIILPPSATRPPQRP